MAKKWKDIIHKKREDEVGELKNITKQPTDEKQEKALALVERYRIIKDNDGHDYVIKVWQTGEFYQWVAHEENDDAGYGYDGEGFEDSRIDGGVLSFTDPRIG
jgi:hypothetical protein